jgi:hypothetical protein
MKINVEINEGNIVDKTVAKILFIGSYIALYGKSAREPVNDAGVNGVDVSLFGIDGESMLIAEYTPDGMYQLGYNTSNTDITSHFMDMSGNGGGDKDIPPQELIKRFTSKIGINL